MEQQRRGKITCKYVCKDWNKVNKIKCNVSCVRLVILATLIVQLFRSHSLPRMYNDRQFQLKNHVSLK